jgi:hypothetical protein
MKNTIRILMAVAAAIAAILVALGTTTPADAGRAPPVGPHRHFIEQPDGTRVQVGPDVCGDPKMQTAFNEFHAHIHFGPANTAFDHDHNPVDIKGGSC